MSRIRERNRASTSGDRRFTNETHGEKKMGRHLERVAQDFFRNRSKETSKTIGLFSQKNISQKKKINFLFSSIQFLFYIFEKNLFGTLEI